MIRVSSLFPQSHLFTLSIIMGSQQGPSERLNIQLGPIDEDFRPTQRFPGISRQTLCMS